MTFVVVEDPFVLVTLQLILWKHTGLDYAIMRGMPAAATGLNEELLGLICINTLDCIFVLCAVYMSLSSQVFCGVCLIVVLCVKRDSIR
jgi:hypothetical protein